LRAALPSPSDMGQCFSTMSYIFQPGLVDQLNKSSWTLT
jgi:hypothetical protein